VVDMAMLGRTILLGYSNYQRINLTPEEEEKLMKELLEHNNRELQRVMDFGKQKGLNEEAIRILCDKQLIMAYTAWTNALEDKVHEIKSKAKKPLSWKDQQKIKEAVEKGLEPKSQEQVLNE
jgi:hypothetical protein